MFELGEQETTGFTSNTHARTSEVAFKNTPKKPRAMF